MTASSDHMICIERLTAAAAREDRMRRERNALQTEVARLRDANKLLHRRAQKAEAVVGKSIADLQAAAGSDRFTLGRALANAAYYGMRAERDEALAKLAELQARLERPLIPGGRQ